MEEKERIRSHSKGYRTAMQPARERSFRGMIMDGFQVFARRPFAILIVSILTLPCLPMLLGCDRQEYDLNASDYRQFHLQAGEALCEKMQECYAPFLRTLRPEFQRQIDENYCMKAVKKDLDEKLKIHTPEIQQLSRLCYTQLLDMDCKEFLVGTVFNPACQALMEKSSAEFQKHPALLRQLKSK